MYMNKYKVIILILILIGSLHAQMTWTQATANAGWSIRAGFSSVIFDNKIWVIGGDNHQSSTYKNDVWYSFDGVNWTQVIANAQWQARTHHTAVVFDNKIWVIGGSNTNDVWYSTDGASWTQVIASAQWSARMAHTSVVFDNKMWVMGGMSGSSNKNDVWYSTDGMNWTQATVNAGWSARYGFTSNVFENKIWVMGGDDGSQRNDVWYSLNGANWTQALANAQWSSRALHTSNVFDNKMWVLGGFNNTYPYSYNDVWYSTGLGIEDNYQMLNANRFLLEVYPNPAKSYFTVRLPLTAYRINIFNVSGKLIKEIAWVRNGQRNDNKRKLQVPLEGINNGVYFVTIQTENYQVTKKLLLIK